MVRNFLFISLFYNINLGLQQFNFDLDLLETI